MTALVIGPESKAEVVGRGTLTDPGWPRPFLRPYPNVEAVGGILPVAWITPEHRWAEMDPMRGRETVALKSCQVCGEGWEDPEAEVVVFVGGKIVMGEGDFREVDEVLDDIDDLPYGRANVRGVLLPALDNSIMHPRCAKLAAHFCPVLRGKRQSDVLFPFGGPHRAIIGRQSDKAIVYTAEQRAAATFDLPEFEVSLYLEGVHAHNFTL